jgi:uncharacterized repeat protein (TIGR03803 family)
MPHKRITTASAKALTTAAIALILISTAWAAPKYKILATFAGGGLWSGLTLDAEGNLYGVTTGGGDNGVGAVFEMSRNARGQWTVITLHSFTGKDGAGPNGDLIFDASGNLYGTASTGGAYDSGTVFEMSPGSGGWSFTTLYDFCHEDGCPDGGGPSAGLGEDKTGHLLGTAGGGPLRHGSGLRAGGGVKRLDL